LLKELTGIYVRPTELARTFKKKEAQQEEIPALRRAIVGPILTQGFPPAERTFIGIIFAEHFALDNTRFMAVPKSC